MLILIFFITTLASNFLMLAYDNIKNHVKIVSFDSQTFDIITIFNISLKTHPLKCAFDDFNNIYFFALHDLHNFTMNKFNFTTHESSLFEESIGSIMIRNNVPYVTTGHYHMSQLNWPKLINVFTFEPYISLLGIASYIPSQNTFMIYAYTDVRSIIIMTGDFKISQIYPIHHQVAFMCYNNNIPYAIIYGRASLQLCSTDLSTNILNCIIIYDTRAFSFYSGLLHDNILYFIAKDESSTFYWVETNMLNFTHTMTKLPYSLDTRCIKLL